MPTVLQNEDVAAASVPAGPQDGPDLLAARELCGDVRRTLDDIMASVIAGTRDLRDGLTWSQNLSRFELASMEQTRILARFPICTTDARFGALVRRARTAFVAFRETVRREIIGAIDSKTDDADCDLALKKVVDRSALADECLKSVEQAISRYWLQFSAGPQDTAAAGNRARSCPGSASGVRPPGQAKLDTMSARNEGHI